MARRSSSKPVDDEPAGSDAGSRIHEYRGSNKPLLEHAAEQSLSEQIQRGNKALHELDARIAVAIIARLSSGDLAPLQVDTVLAIVGRSITEQLVKCGGGAEGSSGFSRGLSVAIHAVVADQFEYLDPPVELDVEAWLTERLPIETLMRALPIELWAPPDLWTALGQREKAINELAESHLRLAKPFVQKVMRQPFEFDDLMNEAFLILRKAAECFDGQTQNRFSSYAGVALQRELKRRSPSQIGVKRHTAAQLREFNDAQRTLEHEYRAAPSIDEVYAKLACNERTRTEIENVRRILAAQRRSQETVESPLLDPQDWLFQDPCAEAGDREEAELFQAAFEKLSALEKSVVVGKWFLGLSFRQMAKRDRKSPRTLGDAYSGAMMKLTRYINPSSTSKKPR